jgi:hypothetical protein
MTATPPLTDEQHAAIRARHQAATGGTWYPQPNYGPHFVAAEHHGYEHGIGTLDFGDGYQADTDREFVLNAHADMGRLLAERDELLAELDGRDEKARKRWIKKQEQQLGIRYADFRAGKWEMDLAMGREMAAAYVAMAKTMLGDAPNYTETRLEFDVKIAESPEVYTLVVQRHAPGALTPHEARQRAEAERDAALAEVDVLRAELATARAQLAGTWPCTCGHVSGQHQYDAVIGRDFCRACPTDMDLHEYTAAPTATT